MKRHFLDERVYLKDLLPPGRGAVTSKTFERCEIVGPLNIYPIGGIIQNCVYHAVDYVMLDEDKVKSGNIHNCFVFNDCRFIDCKIFFVSFLITEGAFEAYNSMGGCNWITKVPEKMKEITSEAQNIR
ncbi:MAG: hypothetical protein AB7U61_07485, partial [Methylocystis sp.]